MRLGQRISGSETSDWWTKALSQKSREKTGRRALTFERPTAPIWDIKLAAEHQFW